MNLEEKTDRLSDIHRDILARILSEHSPRDSKERIDRDRIVAFVGEHRDAHLRTNPLGHLTGSAFVMDPAGQRVLLTHHRKLDRWLQLGGHGEGEWDPARIALREAEEESGLGGLSFHPICSLLTFEGWTSRAPFDVDIHRIPERRGEPAHNHYDVRYVFVAQEGASLNRQVEESHALAWFDESGSRGVGGDASLMRALSALWPLKTR